MALRLPPKLLRIDAAVEALAPSRTTINHVGFAWAHALISQQEARLIRRSFSSLRLPKLLRIDAAVEALQWFRGGLVFEAHRLVYHSA